MELRVLAVGDVVGNPGMDRIRKSLRRLIRQTGADFTVVNERTPVWWASPPGRRRTFWMPGRM